MVSGFFGKFSEFCSETEKSTKRIGKVSKNYSGFFLQTLFKNLIFSSLMTYYLKAVIPALVLTYSCSNHEQQEQHALQSTQQAPQETRIETRLFTLEQHLNEVIQEQETEEKIFLRNIKLLRSYVHEHPELYHQPLEDEQQSTSQHLTHQYSNFLSWSKQTLDSLSAMFIGQPRRQPE